MGRIEKKQINFKGGALIEVIVSVLLISLVFTLFIRIMAILLEASPSMQDAKVYIEFSSSSNFEDRVLTLDSRIFRTEIDILIANNNAYKRLCITDMLHKKPRVCYIQAVDRNLKPDIFQ